MNAIDVRELDGKVVLVCSAQDHRNPPTGVRGTLRVREGSGSGLPVVQAEIEFPQMFTTRAHHRTVTLNEAQISQLFQSEDYGAFTVTLDERLDPEAPPGNE